MREYVKVNQLVVGYTYMTKENDKVVYLGKFPYYKPCIEFLNRHTGESGYVSPDYCRKEMKEGNIEYQYSGVYTDDKHFFALLDNKDTNNWEYVSYKKTYGLLIGCVNASCTPLLNTMLTKLQHDKTISPVNMSKTRLVRYTKEEFFEQLDKIDISWPSITIYSDTGIAYDITLYIDFKKKTSTPTMYKVSSGYNKYSTHKTYLDKYVNQDKKSRFKTKTYKKGTYHGKYGVYTKEYIEILPIDREQLFERLKPSYEMIYLANGSLCDVVGKV